MFGLLVGLIALMGIANGAPDNPITIMLVVFAFLLLALPFVNLQGALVRKLVAALLAIVLAGFAYLLIASSLAGNFNLVGFGIGLFLGGLALMLFAEVLGLRTEEIAQEKRS
jgi:hypothetical protein